MKQCTRCKETFPNTSEFFHKHGAGLRPDCKSCRKAIAQANFLKNRERILAKNKKWKDANPDKVAAQVKRWNKEHPERCKERQAQFKKKNPHKNAEYMRRWRENNREQYRELDMAYRNNNRERVRELAAKARAADPMRFRAYQHNRRVLIRAGGTFTSEDIAAQYARQSGCCAWCSCDLDGVYQIDHVIPVVRGGSNTPDNLVCACALCNRRKNKLLPFTEWNPPNPL